MLSLVCLWHCLINSLPFNVACVNTVVMKYAALSPWGMNEVCCSTGIYNTHSHFLLLLHIWMWLVNEFTGMFCTWSVLRYMHKESKIVGKSASMCSWGHWSQALVSSTDDLSRDRSHRACRYMSCHIHHAVLVYTFCNWFNNTLSYAYLWCGLNKSLACTT